MTAVPHAFGYARNRRTKVRTPISDPILLARPNRSQTDDHCNRSFQIASWPEVRASYCEIRHMIPLYQGQPQLIRKQIRLDIENREGRSFY